MSDNFALTVLGKRREQVLADRSDSERDLEQGEDLMATARQAIARADAKLADLDRAIAALTPAPQAEGDALGEFMKREGAVKWEGGDTPGNDGPAGFDTLVEVLWEDGSITRAQSDCYSWRVEPGATIIAYRVLPSEPAAEAKGEAERFSHEVRFVMQDGVTGSGHYETEEEAASHYGHLAADPTVKKAQRNAIVNGVWKVVEELPDQTAGREPEEVGFRDYAPYNIASSSQHAEESARAQSLPPLLPPEPPPAATPEQLEATGVIDGEAGWWARKLTREPA